MLSVSFWLIAAALTLAVIALSIAMTLDRREQDRRARQPARVERQFPFTEQATAVEWGRKFVIGIAETESPDACPDIIVGPWGATAAQVDEQPRKAA